MGYICNKHTVHQSDMQKVEWDGRSSRPNGKLDMYLSVPCHCAVAVVGYGILTRYVKLQVAHAQGMPGTFSLPSRVSDPDMHQGMFTTHVPWCMPGSLFSDCHWGRWRGKRSRHSRRMSDPQFYESGKRPISHSRNCAVERHTEVHILFAI